MGKHQTGVKLRSTPKPQMSSVGQSSVESGGLYWHFVDIVWVFLFPLLYLVAPLMEKNCRTKSTRPRDRGGEAIGPDPTTTASYSSPQVFPIPCQWLHQTPISARIFAQLFRRNI